MIKTVRVANPADPTQFMTINASDYREAVHGELWATQLPDFDGLPAPTPQRMDPAVRDLAAGMMFNALDMEAVRDRTTPFSSLSPVQQLTYLRDKQQEFNDAKTRFMRYMQVRERELAEEQQRLAQLAPQGNEPTTNPAAATQPPAAPVAPAAPVEKPAETPAAPAGGTAPWAKPPAPANPAAPTFSVEKGPGSKWYVMAGKEPKSAGFPTKAEAEKALEGMKVAE